MTPLERSRRVRQRTRFRRAASALTVLTATGVVIGWTAEAGTGSGGRRH